MGDFVGTVQTQARERSRAGSPEHQAVVAQVRARQQTGGAPAPAGGRRRKGVTILGAGRR